MASVRNADAVAQATRAAEKWLAIVDAGNYAEAWESAASQLRIAADSNQLAQSLSSALKPLGVIVKRTLYHQRYRTEFPGAPDGEHVVLKFHTRFEYKRRAVETITPRREADGAWRVAGYYIR